MDQITFSGAEYQNKKRRTRREIFLERVDKLITWKVISDILGHRSLTSLSAYLRIDTAHLRQLPLPVPK